MRLGLIGVGRWGKNLARVFSSLSDVELVGLCDAQQDVLDALKAQYPSCSLFTTDADELLEHVDAVAIAVETPRHYELTKKALVAGVHTYCEKPLCTNPTEAMELTEIAQQQQVRLMVGHLLEYHPAVEYIDGLMARGELGEVRYMACRRLNLGVVRTEEDAWWSLAPHDISVCCFLFNAVPTHVLASGQCFLQDGIADVVFATLRFPGGRLAHIHVSWLDPRKVREIMVVGSERMVLFDDVAATEKLRIYDKGAYKQQVESYVDVVTLKHGDTVIPALPPAEPLVLECQHFINCIQQGTVPRSDASDGWRVVRVLAAGSKSLEKGGWVNV